MCSSRLRDSAHRAGSARVFYYIFQYAWKLEKLELVSSILVRSFGYIKRIIIALDPPLGLLFL